MPNQESILAIYDISGIQEYIFATSRLSENAGASRIVGRALKEQLPPVLQDVIAKTMDGNAIIGWQNARHFRMKEDPGLPAEIVYIGGGSAIVAYRDQSVYDEVNKAFAKCLVETSYTLALATAYVKTDFQDYGRDREELDLKLDAVKASMLRQRPMGALPIVEQEALTGLPVTRRYNCQNQDQDLSTLQVLKRQDYEAVKHKAEYIYMRSLPFDAGFAVEMEDLISKKGEDGFAAVVHIDGNGMGEAIHNAIKKYKDYEHSVINMRRLSGNITDIYQNIFEKMVDLVYKRMKGSENKCLSFPPLLCQEKYILPIRPLIMDGDDITFICNGRLGVPLAALFLRCLAQEKNPPVPLSACAGVALVHSHFPFNIAYEIAESCCRNAKKKRLEKKDERGDKNCGYLDFHLVRGAYVKEIRNLREDDAAEGSRKKRLLKRPYQITASPDRGHDRSFDRLDDILAGLPAPDAKPEGEQWPRSRLKKIYEAYLMGPQHIEFLGREFASRGYSLSSLAGQPLDGGFDTQGETPLFDALELMDLYERNIFSSLCDSEIEEESK